MRRQLRNLSLSAAAIVGGLSLGAPVQAATDAGVKVGVLSCHESSGWGFVFGSSKDLKCVFSAGNDRVENYTGRISKFGVDIGYTRAGVLVWTVLAPTVDVAPGALSGAYGGVSAGGSLTVGGAANVLIGGSTKAISLQPLSIEGTSGVNVAAGIASLTLDRRP
jgi:hypothetical protein